MTRIRDKTIPEYDDDEEYEDEDEWWIDDEL